MMLYSQLSRDQRGLRNLKRKLEKLEQPRAASANLTAVVLNNFVHGAWQAGRCLQYQVQYTGAYE